MSKSWINQSIERSKQWGSKYNLTNQVDFLLPLNQARLNTAIENGSIFKDDQTTTVAKLASPHGSFVLKRYNPRSFSHKLKRALRRSRAERCWHMSYMFAQAGLNVARPVFMYEDRFGPVCKDAYFANEMINGDELLGALPKMSQQEKQKVAHEFEQALMRMQTHLISHGDMKASNLLWVDEELYFVDLDAARQHSSKKSWYRANRRDRKRFMKNWRSHPELMRLFSWVG